MRPYMYDMKLYIDTNTKEYMIINEDGEILYEADKNTMKTTYIASDYKRYKRHLRRLVKITKILQSANEKITERYDNMKNDNKKYNRVMDYICDHICEGCDEDPAKCFNQGYCEYDGPDDPGVQENEQD